MEVDEIPKVIKEGSFSKNNYIPFSLKSYFWRAIRGMFFPLSGLLEAYRNVYSITVVFVDWHPQWEWEQWTGLWECVQMAINSVDLIWTVQLGLWDDSPPLIWHRQGPRASPSDLCPKAHYLEIRITKIPGNFQNSKPGCLCARLADMTYNDLLHLELGVQTAFHTSNYDRVNYGNDMRSRYNCYDSATC